MPDLFDVLIVVHVACGTVGLISGTIAAAVAKGKKLHNGSGMVFFYAMVCTGLSAIVISCLPNHHSLFLMAVGGFTLHMVLTGYRMIWLKRHQLRSDKLRATNDWLLLFFGLGFGLFLVVMAGSTAITTKQLFALVPGVFGLICLVFVGADAKLISGKEIIKNKWLSNHISRMIGALVASYTAFLVVNVHIQQNWILWLLPSAVGGIVIWRFRRKYTPKRRLTAPLL